MGLEGTHAEFVGEGEGLLIVGFGCFSIWGIVVHGNVAEKAEGLGLVSPLLACTEEIESLVGEAARVFQTPVQSIDLTQSADIASTPAVSTANLELL